MTSREPGRTNAMPNRAARVAAQQKARADRLGADALSPNVQRLGKQRFPTDNNLLPTVAIEPGVPLCDGPVVHVVETQSHDVSGKLLASRAQSRCASLAAVW